MEYPRRATAKYAARPVPKGMHGKIYTYNTYGCLCWRCKKAMREYYHERRNTIAYNRLISTRLFGKSFT